jgi:hypothetical protein
MHNVNNFNSISAGEDKDDLANFDINLRKNFLCIYLI